MARLPRLVVAGQAHYVIQRGHGAVAVFGDDADRATYLGALSQAAAAEHVRVHAWALLATEVQLLVTPEQKSALGRMVQALGRRYAAACNRRYQRRGTLWDGRFRCAVVESGAPRLAALRLIDGQSTETGWTSASQRLGGARGALLSDPPEIWQLGNTPFEREAAYRTLLAQGLPQPESEALRRAALGGAVVGSAAFAAEVSATTSRPVTARPRGRPRRRAGA